VPGDNAVTIAVAGDVHFAGRTAALLDDPGTALGPAAPVLSAADIAIVNLETAVTDRGTPEPKKYHFHTKPAAFDALRAAGVDLVTLANNHTLDYGRVGLADTLSAASDAKVPVVGAGKDSDAAFAPWIKEVRGVRVAVVGVSQIRELSDSWAARPDRAGVASALDVERTVQAVRDAKARSDIVVVYVHWGQEGDSCPTDRMTSLAGRLAAAGATAVVGTHAHLLLGDGWQGGTYVAYGTGNFVWWLNDAYSNDTGVLRLTVRDGRVNAADLSPMVISASGQPVPVKGTEADRVRAKFASLRACTGLAARPS
jgi:poly-gamma-glutamate synthesis protein (capsule biosynthesis protein)